MDLSSLLEIGFGLGVAFSLYVAPFRERERALFNRIDAKKNRIEMQPNSQKRTNLKRKFLSADKEVKLISREKERLQKGFGILALLGATANLYLILNHSSPVYTEASYDAVLVVFVSIVYYIFIYIVAEIVAREIFAKMHLALDEINKQ